MDAEPPAAARDRSTLIASSKSRASSGSIVTMNWPRRSSRPSNISSPTVSGNSLRFLQDALGKFRRKMVLPDDRKHVHAGRGARPEDLDDLAFGIDVARFPRLEPDDDLVAALRSSSATAAAAGPGRKRCGRCADRPARRRRNSSTAASVPTMVSCARSRMRITRPSGAVAARFSRASNAHRA